MEFKSVVPGTNMGLLVMRCVVQLDPWLVAGYKIGSAVRSGRFLHETMCCCMVAKVSNRPGVLVGSCWLCLVAVPPVLPL